MNEETIQIINSKWAGLNLGEFIQSPSVHYSELLIGSGARASAEVKGVKD